MSAKDCSAETKVKTETRHVSNDTGNGAKDDDGAMVLVKASVESATDELSKANRDVPSDVAAKVKIEKTEVVSQSPEHGMVLHAESKTSISEQVNNLVVGSKVNVSDLKSSELSIAKAESVRDKPKKIKVESSNGKEADKKKSEHRSSKGHHHRDDRKRKEHNSHDQKDSEKKKPRKSASYHSDKSKRNYVPKKGSDEKKIHKSLTKEGSVDNKLEESKETSHRQTNGGVVVSCRRLDGELLCKPDYGARKIVGDDVPTCKVPDTSVVAESEASVCPATTHSTGLE